MLLSAWLRCCHLRYTARSRLRVAAGLSLAALAAATASTTLTACKQTGRPASADKVLVELRGPDGHLRLQVAKNGQNYGDDRLAWFAGPEEHGTLQRLPGDAGTAALDSPRRSLRRTQDGGLVLTRGTSVAVTVERRGALLRLGNGDGFPAGRIHTASGSAQLHGPAGELQVQARQEGERVAIADREGRALGFVLGAATPEQALVAFLPGLAPVEQALLLATPLPESRPPSPRLNGDETRSEER